MGQRPLCVLPVVYRLWASVRLEPAQDWFYFWVPDTFFVVAKVSPVLMLGTPLRWILKRFLSGATQGHVHVFAADIVVSFVLIQSVDRGILDCALGRLGLPNWLGEANFAYHAQVRLRFKLAAGLGEA